MVSSDRMKSIEDASKTRKDSFMDYVSENRSDLKYPRDCLSAYTSQTNLDRLTAKRKAEELPGQLKGLPEVSSPGS